MQAFNDALAVYFREAGEAADQPALDSSWYDEVRGGWVFENIRGALAFVRDDRAVVQPVHDAESGEWVLPG